MINKAKTTQINSEVRDSLISNLTDELPVLRTKLGLSQDEIACLLGISRQTYSTIETKKRKMTWSIYLSLVLIFDNNKKTHEFIRKQELYPSILFGDTDDKESESSLLTTFVEDENIREKLDEQAIHAIKTVVMVEYARCNNMSGEAVIKAFTGRNLIQNSDQDIIAKESIATIKKKNNGKNNNE